MRPTALKLGGKDLPHGPLSALMENKVKERLQLAYEAEAKEKGVPLDQVQVPHFNSNSTKVLCFALACCSLEANIFGRIAYHVVHLPRWRDMYWFLVSRGGRGGRFTFFERKLVDAFFF